MAMAMAMAHSICEVLRLLNSERGIYRRQCVISISFISCCICFYYAMSCEREQQKQQQQQQREQSEKRVVLVVDVALMASH